MDLSKLTIITQPDFDDPIEAVRLGILLRSHNIGAVHIRKPGASAREIGLFIEQLPKEYRHRYIVSEHCALVREYHLGGLHLSTHSWRGLSDRPELPPNCRIGVSCHSSEELESLPFTPDYAYLSPLASSLSKEGYEPTLTKEDCTALCAQTSFPLIALGGITPENAASFLRMGFAGVATLGYWAKRPISELRTAIEAFARPRILLCGGVAPTALAGLTADVRSATALAADVYTVATMVTRQNAQRFDGCSAISDSDVSGQIESLVGEPAPQIAKIGLVASAHQARAIVTTIRNVFPQCLIVWDPILSSSSGHLFHPIESWDEMRRLTAEVDVVTPNDREASSLFDCASDEDFEQIASAIDTVIIRKGISNQKGGVSDLIYRKGLATAEVSTTPGGKDRHGTGCLYSTVLAVELARGRTVKEAATAAQTAVSNYRKGRDCRTQIDPATATDQHKEATSRSLGRTMFITHGADMPTVLRQTDAVLGVQKADIVQLRMKQATFDDLLRSAQAMRILCHSYGVKLLINDSVEVALLSEADGVHLGQQDTSLVQAREILGTNAIIGATCNTEGDLFRAARLPIDYIGLGPYRFTRTKTNLAPTLGLSGYSHLTRSFANAGYDIPIYAIGGIKPEEVPLLRKAGAYGVAMSGSLIDSFDQDPGSAPDNAV